jgi:plastocyanin domain-containing protein
VPVEIVTGAPGECEFTRGMNMYKGKIIVRQSR